MKLKDISKIYSGNSINEKIKEQKYTGLENGVEYISTKDISFNSEISYDNGVRIPFNELDNFKTAPTNTVFICAEGGSAGRKLAISDRELCFVNKLFAVVASKLVLPKYLFYSLKTEDFIEQFNGSMTGIIGGVSLNKFRELEIKVPSISTQQKIVAKLDAVFAEIDTARASAEANAKNAEALFQGYLTEIIKNESQNSKTVNLGMICEIARGGSPRPIDKFITDDKDGINWIKIGDATRSKKYIYETREKIIKEGISRSRLVKDGDFLLSNSMSYGRPYIMRTTGCIHDGWLVLSKYEEFLDIDFFYFLLSSALVVKQFDSLAQGSTVSNLNKELVSRVEVKLPSLNKQKSIVYKLNELSNNVDIIKKSYANKVIELLKLKNSILHKAFSGELVKD